MPSPVDPLRIPTYVRLVNTGRDQIALPTRHWCDFEDPLPAVLLGLAEILDATAMYDVGANTGFYSVLLGKARPDLPLRVFEPVPHIAELCRTNLEANLLDVEVTEVALSDAIGTAPLFMPTKKHGMIETSASLNPWFGFHVKQQGEVPTTTVDAVAGRDRVGLMKIDVEGYEHVVLRGGESTVARDRPLLAVEVLPTSALDELADFVARHDYVVMSLHPGLEVRQQERVTFQEDGWNQLFVPGERAEEVQEVLSAVRRRLDAVTSVSRWEDVRSAEDYVHLHSVAEARRQVQEELARPESRSLRQVVRRVWPW